MNERFIFTKNLVFLQRELSSLFSDVYRDIVFSLSTHVVLT